MTGQFEPSGGPARRCLRTQSGVEHALPLFLPVFQPDSPLLPRDAWNTGQEIDGCIVNAYFLYKRRELRERFQSGLTLREYVGVDGLIMTDSGAFQGFTQRLLLSNKAIVRFQETIRTDVASPLDLVTPPGDSRAVAEKKLEATLRRVDEAQRCVSGSILAGVQQGGRFLDLRVRGIDGLVRLGCRYVALGSLVPFFTRNHDLGFVGQVLRQARAAVGSEVPLHVYGAGDPVELPFMAALGADVFDSSSYAHYAEGGYYMTPYGALREPGPIAAGEYACPCPVCQEADGPAEIFADARRLARHNLWTICHTVRRLRELVAAGTLDAHLAEVLQRHAAWFPDSKLPESWNALDG